MASLCCEVFCLYRLSPLTWAKLARQTSHLGEQRRTTASLLPQLTAASDAGSPENFSFVRSRKYTQEPECRTAPMPFLLEKSRSHVDGGPLGLEMVTSSLLDMGFSEAHVGELLSIQPGPSPQQLLDITSELILLGLNPEPICVALKKSPQLLKLPVKQMRKRCGYLRKLGLGEGKLKRVLLCGPDIFTMSQQDIDDIVRVLREKCLFTVQQVTQILCGCPYILREDPGELEYKFQYAYFRMGIKHPDVVKTHFLQYSITKIKQRHIYLERLGRYQTPDKKGQTQILNPLLKDIFRISEAEFLARTARSSAEEFEVFKKLLAREEEEGPKSLHGDVEDEDVQDEAAGDEDGEEEFTDGGTEV